MRIGAWAVIAAVLTPLFLYRRISAGNSSKSGNGMRKCAKSVRELKPALYDAVFDAAVASLAGDGEPAAADDDLLGGDPPEQTAGGLAADMDPTAQPARDDMGL